MVSFIINSNPIQHTLPRKGVERRRLKITRRIYVGNECSSHLFVEQFQPRILRCRSPSAEFKIAVRNVVFKTTMSIVDQKFLIACSSSYPFVFLNTIDRHDTFDTVRLDIEHEILKSLLSNANLSIGSESVRKKHSKRHSLPWMVVNYSGHDVHFS